MRCNICGRECAENTGICPNCVTGPKVQVLSPEERESFRGLTIEQNHRQEKSANPKSPFQKVFVFNSNTSGALPKLIVGALLLFVAVVFLPLALVFAATWGLNRLNGRGRQ